MLSKRAYSEDEIIELMTRMAKYQDVKEVKYQETNEWNGRFFDYKEVLAHLEYLKEWEKEATRRYIIEPGFSSDEVEFAGGLLKDTRVQVDWESELRKEIYGILDSHVKKGNVVLGYDGYQIDYSINASEELIHIYNPIIGDRLNKSIIVFSTSTKEKTESDVEVKEEVLLKVERKEKESFNGLLERFHDEFYSRIYAKDHNGYFGLYQLLSPIDQYPRQTWRRDYVYGKNSELTFLGLFIAFSNETTNRISVSFKNEKVRAEHSYDDENYAVEITGDKIILKEIKEPC